MANDNAEVKIEKHHHIDPSYKRWGQFGSKARLAPSADIQAKVEDLVAKAGIDLTGYTLSSAKTVDCYQGQDLKSQPAIHYRYEREDGNNKGLYGEHISVIYDTKNNRLLGVTRMQKGLVGDVAIQHHEALCKAIDFLKLVTPELVPESAEIPALKLVMEKGKEVTPDQRMEFISACKLGAIHIHWIDGHKEVIKINSEEKEINGMKVKMSIPPADSNTQERLWMWVIIDNDGNVQTFERNISWDFEKFQRRTQMWLHDAWLAENGIADLSVDRAVTPEQPRLGH